MIAQYEAPDKPAELFSPRLYGTGLRHKHLTEMQKVAGLEQPPVFCPVVDDYYKGMATTIQLHNRYLRGQPTAREICHILAAYYAGQPLVSVRWGGDAPTLPANALAGTDRLGRGGGGLPFSVRWSWWCAATRSRPSSPPSSITWAKAPLARRCRT